jgi:hypothetical protein
MNIDTVYQVIRLAKYIAKVRRFTLLLAYYLQAGSYHFFSYQFFYLVLVQVQIVDNKPACIK